MSFYVASIKFGDLPWWSGKITRVPVALIVNAVSSIWNEDSVPKSLRYRVPVSEWFKIRGPQTLTRLYLVIATTMILFTL